MGGYALIWEGRICFAQRYGLLITQTTQCQEPKNHSKENQPNYIRKVEWIPLDLCNHSIILRDNNWFSIDWLWHPGIYGVAANGTPWLYGTNLWPFLPPEWLGSCILSFSWSQERICPTVTMAANLPLLKARWTHSVFSWYDHLAAVFVLSISLEDVIAHNRSPW